MSSQRSYLNAVLRDPDSTSDMIAPESPGPPTLDERNDDLRNGPVALVVTNSVTNSTAHNTDQASEPNKFWNGERSTLAPFLTELNVSLLADNSALHTSAVEYYAMLNNGKTVLVHPGQAAQLDGQIERPAYTWNEPAPEDAGSYGVDHVTIVNTIHANYQELRLRNPALPADDPAVPAGTPYPIDKTLYMLSAPMMSQHDKRLRGLE